MIVLAILLAPSVSIVTGVAALAAFDFVADRFARRDRRRHIAECSAYGGKLAVDPPVVSPPSVVVCERILAADSSYAAELERMRDGAAFAEAMVCQLAEIRSLPTVARSRWS